MLNFILKNNTHTNPLLFLGGVSSINLGYILDYIYKGEVNIYQEQLDSFLESAQKLEIEGLLGDSKNCNEDSNTIYPEENIDQLHEKPNHYQPENEKCLVKMNSNTPATQRRQYSRSTSKNNVERIDVSSMTPEETEQKMKELYQKIDDSWSCLACDYKHRKNFNIRRHIETHIDGLSYTCTLCNTEFRLKDSLNRHISRLHRK